MIKITSINNKFMYIYGFFKKIVANFCSERLVLLAFIMKEKHNNNVICSAIFSLKLKKKKNSKNFI